MYRKKFESARLLGGIRATKLEQTAGGHDRATGFVASHHYLKQELAASLRKLLHAEVV